MIVASACRHCRMVGMQTRCPGNPSNKGEHMPRNLSHLVTFNSIAVTRGVLTESDVYYHLQLEIDVAINRLDAKGNTKLADTFQLALRVLTSAQNRTLYQG